MKSYGEWIDDKSEEPFKYPKAGQNAPAGVKQEIENYNKLPPEKKVELPLLWWLLGSTTQDYKMSKKDALYTEESKTKNQKCGNCKYAYKHLVSDIHICSVMRGQIEPEGWCRLWEKGEK
jgi:hypothetical protein